MGNNEARDPEDELGGVTDDDVASPNRGLEGTDLELLLATPLQPLSLDDTLRRRLHRPTTHV